MKKIFLLPILFNTMNLFAQFQFIAPVNGSVNHHPDRNIILREGHELDASVLHQLKNITIIGSSSGAHTFTADLCDDHKTLILKPDIPFAYSEKVNVNVNDGLKRADGKMTSPVQFSFSIQREYTREERAGFDTFAKKVQAEGVAVPEQIKTNPEKNTDPFITVSVNTNPSPGDVFFDYFSGFYTRRASYHIINNEGDSIYGRMEGRILSDFKINHNGYLTLFNYLTARFELLDSSYNLLKIYGVTNGYITDTHDFQIFPDGHYFMIGDDYEIVDMTVYNPDWQPNATVLGTVIQEFDAGDHLIFEWRSFDHLSILEAWHENLANGYIDPVHTNAIEEDEDGNILVSHRNIDQITKIDVHTGDFIWRLGGMMNQFTFTNDPAQFNYQHDVRRDAHGLITLFDNNNWGSPQASIAKEYRLNEANRTATLVWSYQHPNVGGKPVFGSAMGSVQRLPNGNTFINWGWIGYQINDPNFTEIDSSNQIVWEAQLAEPLYYISYRAHRYLWTPCARPFFAKLHALDISATSASLTWGHSTNAVNYGIRYRVRGSENWTSVNTGGNVTSIVISALRPDTKYEWQVEALCDAPAPAASNFSEIKLFNTLSSRFSLEETTALKVYPNPASDLITISFPNASYNSVYVVMLNELGEVVLQENETSNQNNFQIHVDQLPDGIYLLKVFTGENWYVQKVEVSK